MVATLLRASTLSNTTHPFMVSASADTQSALTQTVTPTQPHAYNQIFVALLCVCHVCIVCIVHIENAGKKTSGKHESNGKSLNTLRYQEPTAQEEQCALLTHTHSPCIRL